MKIKVLKNLRKICASYCCLHTLKKWSFYLNQLWTFFKIFKIKKWTLAWTSEQTKALFLLFSKYSLEIICSNLIWKKLMNLLKIITYCSFIFLWDILKNLILFILNAYETMSIRLFYNFICLTQCFIPWVT